MATRTSITINSVGTIGDARIIGIDGSTRAAHISEKIFPREMIMTAANAAVHFQLGDGCLLDIGQESEATMSADAGAPDAMLAAAAQSSVAAMQAAIPTGGKVVGTLTVVVGNVKIIGVDSVPRVAKAGDKVLSTETLATESDGIVQVRLENGKSIDLGGDSKLALTDEIIVDAGNAVSFVPGTPTPGPPVVPEQDAAAIQEVIAAGQDPSQVAAATAAGSDGSGATPVVIDQSNSTGEVTSGFPTGGLDNEILLGGGGNDILVYDPADLSETAITVHNGGSGDDTSRFDGSAQSLNVTALADTRILSIQTIDLKGTVDDPLALNVQDVLDLSSTTNQVLVMGNVGDFVNAPGQGWLMVGAPVSIGGRMYQTYTDGSATATLLVDTDVTRNIL